MASGSGNKRDIVLRCILDLWLLKGEKMKNAQPASIESLTVCWTSTSVATCTTTEMFGARYSLHLLVRLEKAISPGRTMDA